MISLYYVNWVYQVYHSTLTILKTYFNSYWCIYLSWTWVILQPWTSIEGLLNVNMSMDLKGFVLIRVGDKLLVNGQGQPFGDWKAQSSTQDNNDIEGDWTKVVHWNKNNKP